MRFFGRLAISVAVLGLAVPLANGQDFSYESLPSLEERALYREARTSALKSWYVAKAQVAVTFGTAPKPTRLVESFDVRAFGDRYLVDNYRSSKGKRLGAKILGLTGTVYYPAPGVPDSVAVRETSAEALAFRAGSPLQLPDLDMIGAASFREPSTAYDPGPVNARGYYANETVIMKITHDRAQKLLAQSLVGDATAAALAPKISIKSAVVHAKIETMPTSRVTQTDLQIDGVLSKEGLAAIKGLWIVGKPADMPLTLRTSFTPLGLPAAPSVARPKRSMSEAAYTSTLRARAQITAAVTAIEKYGKARKTVYGMTAADVRRSDNKVRLVRGRGTTAAGTVGYTMLDNGRRYALRVTARNGWTYTAVRPIKGKFTRTCVRAGGATCGTW